MKIRWLFIDLDGTLLNQHKQPGSKGLSAIRTLKQKGLHIGLATGRSVDIVVKLLTSWQLINHIDVIIGMNGAQIYSLKEAACFRRHLLSAEQLNAVISHCLPYNINYYLYDMMKQKAYLRRLDEYSKHIITINQSAYVIQELPIINNYEKLLVLCEPSKSAAIINSLQPFDDLRVMQTLPYCLEIVSIENSKLSAVRQICEHEGCSLREVMALGDEMNDLDLLLDCGIGVAMLNGNEQLKASAECCTEYDNNHDGVGEFLYQYFHIE